MADAINYILVIGSVALRTPMGGVKANRQDDKTFAAENNLSWILVLDAFFKKTIYIFIQTGGKNNFIKWTEPFSDSAAVQSFNSRYHDSKHLIFYQTDSVTV